MSGMGKERDDIYLCGEVEIVFIIDCRKGLGVGLYL